MNYNYYEGVADAGPFKNGDDGPEKFGILCEPELFKDLCLVDEKSSENNP